MKKILFSNLFTAVFIIAVLQPGQTRNNPNFVYSHEQHQEDIKNLEAQGNREIASIQCQKSTLSISDEDYEKYKINDQLWEEQVHLAYTEDIELLGSDKKVEMYRIVKPFLKDFYHEVQRIYGEKLANEKIAAFFRAKREFKNLIEEKEQIYIREESMRNDLRDIEVERATKKFREELVSRNIYSEEEIEDFALDYERDYLGTLQDTEHVRSSRLREGYRLDYHAQIEKIFGKSLYEDLLQRLEQKNLDLHAEYGNLMYRQYKYETINVEENGYMTQRTRRMEEYSVVETPLAAVKIEL